jgi:O-antigen/teichoic acid export membrane protein
MELGYRQRLRGLAADSLLRNGMYIMGKTAVPALLGFGFWIIAARLLSAAEVGRAAVLVSAILLVSIVTNLGIGQVYISRLASRRPGRQWSLTVSTGLFLAGSASLAGGTLAAVLLSELVPPLEKGVQPAALALLPLGVIGAAWFLILDHVFIAERHARPAFLRNAAAGLTRLGLIGLMPVVPVEGVTWIMIVWVATFLLFDALALTWSLPALGRGFKPTLAGWRREASAIRHLVAGHHAINLGAQTSAYVLPLLVAARLGAADNAYFYTTFILANSLTFIAPAISDSLFAEGAHRPERVTADLRRAAKHVAILGVLPALVLLLAGPAILSAFGPEYAEAGGALLRILVGAAFFSAGLILATAVLRVRGHLREGAFATFAGLAVTVAATWLLLPPLGLEGAGYGWALGSATGMAMAIAFVLRGRRPVSGVGPAAVGSDRESQNVRRV